MAFTFTFTHAHAHLENNSSWIACYGIWRHSYQRRADAHDRSSIRTTCSYSRWIIFHWLHTTIPHPFIGSSSANCILFILHSSRLHRTKGSPVKPREQLQIGLWFTTLQNAFSPHVFGHGSVHFCLIHALSCGHSELTTHSGRHCGGIPT